MPYKKGRSKDLMTRVMVGLFSERDAVKIEIGQFTQHVWPRAVYRRWGWISMEGCCKAGSKSM